MAKTQKYKFVAQPVKSLKLIESGQENLEVYKEETFGDAEVFDLEELNLQQLVKNIKKSVNKRPSMFLFLRNRENKKIRLETEKINILVSNISSLKGLGKEMLDLKADAILTNETLSYLIADKKREFEHEFERKVEEHYTFKHLEKNKRIKSDLENDKVRAEIEEIKARTMEQKERAKYLRRARKSIDTLPAPMRTYLLAQMFGKHPEQDKNFEMEENIANYMRDKYNAEIKTLNAESDIKDSESEFKKWLNDRKMGRI
jgi:hypothetical protein